MATVQCPIQGHISGYNGYNYNGCNGDYTTGYSKNMIAGAIGTSSGTQLYGYVMKFTTPSFTGTSASLTLNIAAEDGYGSSGYPKLNYAICSSDANKTKYYGVSGTVSDSYQMATGTMTFNLANGATGMCTFTLPITGLAANTSYYLMMWNGSGTSVTIKSMTTTTWGQPIMYLNYNEAPAHTHTYTSTTVAATCNSKGYTKYTCSCGYSYNGNYTSILDHSWDSGTVTTSPTYDAAGVKTHTCSKCGASFQISLAKLGAVSQLTPTVSIAKSSAAKKYVPYIYDSDSGTWKRQIGYVSKSSTFNPYY